MTNISKEKEGEEHLLHRLVYLKEIELLRIILLKEREKCPVVGFRHPQIDNYDLRGYTPLHIAIITRQLDMVDLLINVGGASVLKEGAEGWSSISEAIISGNKDILKIILARKQEEIYRRISSEASKIAKKIEDSIPDCKFEIKWGLKSWVPFLSSFCPSDVYTIWKKGSKLRIDSTLVGFDNLKWIRGKQSFIFNLEGPDSAPVLTAINHTDKIYKKTYTQSYNEDDSTLFEKNSEKSWKSLDREANEMMQEKTTKMGLTVETTQVKQEHIGMWNFKNPRRDIISGQHCSIWKVEGLQLKVQSRYEHLNLSSTYPKSSNKPKSEKDFITSNYKVIDYKDYFSSHQEYFSFGLPRHLKISYHNINPTLWIVSPTPTFPLQLNQFLALLDIVCWYSPTLSEEIHNLISILPPGFPLKINAPILPTLSLNLQFDNFQFGQCDDNIFDLPNEEMGYFKVDEFE